MTKIVAFSDTHGQHRDKELTKWFFDNPADILLFAGDIQYNDYDSGKDFLKWIDGLPYTHKILVFGNHDGNYETTLQMIGSKNIIFLNNESICIDNINIFGSPYSVKFGNWWFMKPDNELAIIYEKIPENTNIIVTHSPAYKRLDLTCSGIHAGSMSLSDRISKLKDLKYHICGHIHEAYGVNNLYGTIHINASIVDEKYKLTNMPFAIEYRE